MMGHGGAEAMAPGLDELALVQPRPLFAPALAGGDGREGVYQVLPGPLGCTLPAYAGCAVIQVNGARLAVETEPGPVPQLECEQVRGRADFQNHGVPARAVHGSGRNEKVVVG